MRRQAEASTGVKGTRHPWFGEISVTLRIWPGEQHSSDYFLTHRAHINSEFKFFIFLGIARNET